MWFCGVPLVVLFVQTQGLGSLSIVLVFLLRSGVWDEMWDLNGLSRPSITLQSAEEAALLTTWTADTDFESISPFRLSRHPLSSTRILPGSACRGRRSPHRCPPSAGRATMESRPEIDWPALSLLRWRTWTTKLTELRWTSKVVRESTSLSAIT
jgi:hypothetical protein